MRIGMFADMYLPHVSGVTNHISLYKRYFESCGHEVILFTFGDTDYEDAELPPWVLDWEARHPGDASEAADILSREPAPARKIPKGEAR